MQYGALAVTLVAFAAGVVAVHRFAPPLAPTTEGRVALWIVAALAGASAGVIADHLWVAVRELTLSTNVELVGLGYSERIVVDTLRAVLFEGGALLALAALVHLLAPAGPEQDA